MHFIDKEQNLPIGFDDFIEYRLQTFLEFTAEFCPGNQRAHIERIERLVFQRFRHIPGHNAAGQPFDNRRLAYARFTNQYRVILRAAGENFNRTADFLVTTNYWVKLALPRGCGQITAEFFQRLIAFFGILARDILFAVLFDGTLNITLGQLELLADGLHIATAVFGQT